MGELTGAMRALKNVKEAELIGMPKLKKCVLMGGLKNVESVKMENAGRVDTSVLPSPVLISAIRP